jgi:glycosyltransferase involved in cell wall biosynthesis
MPHNLVTVCIPAYNSEKTIAETLRSLLQQTYKNVEIYVIDNVSTDRTREIVKSFKDVRLQVNQKNIGGEPNLKKCRYIGEGKYRAIYHADDVYEPDMIERAVAVLEKNHNIGAVLTGAKIINVNGKEIGRSKTFSQLGLPNEYFHRFDLLTLLKLILRRDNFLFCPSVMARSAVIETIEDCLGADLDLDKNDVADLDLWFRIAKNYGLGLINKPLMRYRRSKQQISYKLHTLRTFKSDIFKTLDYWMNQLEVKKQLNNADWGWYKEQIRRDNLQCSARALIAGNKILSKELLKKSCSIKSFYYGLQSKMSIKFLLLLIFMCVINLPGFNILLKPFLCKVLNK